MPKSLAFALVYVAAMVVLWACIGNGGSAAVDAGGPDAGSSDTAQIDDYVIDVNTPLPDATTSACSLYDPSAPMGSDDPVALCVQQSVLSFNLQYAYTPGHGVAPSWSSAAPYAAATAHDWRDDLGLAGALGGFYCSAEVYGNTQTQAAFDAVLADLAMVLTAELKSQPPTGYDGEIYFRLRWAETGYNYFNDKATAGALAAAADAYAASLQAQAVSVAATGDGGAGDAGSAGGTVIGTSNGDGTVSYQPAQTVMAAAALLDMAVVHAKDPDAGSAPATWMATAQQVLAYVQARGRDPQTGLYYQSLVTSSDPGHDALGPGQPTNDALLTDTQAWILMGLARAQDALAILEPLVDDAGTPTFDSGLPPPPAYWTAGANLAQAMTTAGLFDGSTTPPTPPNPGAFMQGLIASTGVLLTNKASIGNAILLGGFHRIASSVVSNVGYELGEIRQAVTEYATCDTSLLTVVCDPSGPIQQALLPATSRGWGLPAALALDGGPSGPLPGGTDYQTEATIAMVEGLSQLWHGATHLASCAP